MPEKSPETYHDAVHMAAQLGRLDLVSALIAIIGIALVVGGLFAYFDIRATAKRIARDEARSLAQELVERRANEYLQAELPGLLEEYSYLFGSGSTSDDEADEIAEAQEE